MVGCACSTCEAGGTRPASSADSLSDRINLLLTFDVKSMTKEQQQETLDLCAISADDLLVIFEAIADFGRKLNVAVTTFVNEASRYLSVVQKDIELALALEADQLKRRMR